jgi:hypothetical protein
MSLIQDALKRQQEESGGSRVPLKAAAALSMPDAMPVPSSPGQANRSLSAVPPVDPGKPVQPGKPWKLIAGIIVICILIVWGGGLLVVPILKPSADHTVPGPSMPDMTHGRKTLGKASVKAPPPAVQPSATAISKPVVITSLARESASRPLFSPAAVAAPAFADEGEDTEQNVALPSAKEQAVAVAVPEQAAWPRLRLSAIFSNVAASQSGARLNNRLILLGDQIEGVTLVEIRRDSAVLQRGTEIRVLKMGMTLN